MTSFPCLEAQRLLRRATARPRPSILLHLLTDGRGPFPLVSCFSSSSGLHPLRVLDVSNWSEMEAYLLWVLLLPVHLSNLPDRGRNIIITIIVILVLDFGNSVLRAKEGQ